MALRPSVQQVSCPIVLATTMALVAAISLGAQTQDQKSKPASPTPGGLTGEPASKVAKLNQQISQVWATGRFGEAMTPAREVLEIHTRLQGAEHWETVNARYQLDSLKQLASLPEEGQRAMLSARSESRRAIALEARAEYREAEKNHGTVLLELRRWRGEDHLDTAAAYNNLANNLRNQGRYAAALSLFQKALDIRRKVLGENHPGTAESYSNLAVHLGDQGRYADAISLHQKALEIRRKALGEDHPVTAESYNNLAMILRRQGRPAEAMPLVQKALEIRRKALGEDHPATADSYNSLARNLTDQGRYADAMPLNQKALEIRRKTLGEDHRLTAESYNNLAANLTYRGRYADAMPLNQKALDIRRKALGEDHPITAQSYSNLAANLDGQRQYADASPLHQKALEIRRQTLGEDHPDTAYAYNNLASNLTDQGRYADAMPLNQKALEIRRKALGEDHPDTATSYNNLASNLGNQGRYADTLPLYQKALEIRRKALGEDHPDTAQSYDNLAVPLHALGRVPEAITHWTAAAESLERGRRALSSSGLGRSQAVRYDTLPMLAVALASQGQVREAWRRWESSLGRGLLDDLSARQLRPMTAEQRDKEGNLVGEIQQLEEQIGSLSREARSSGQSRLEYLRRQRDTLRGQLAELGQAIDAQHGAFGDKRASLEEIQAMLPPDAALIGWVDEEWKWTSIASEHWACLVAAQGAPVWVRIPGTGADGAWTKSDNRRLDDLRAALLGKDPGWRDLAAQAARQRLAPLKPQLEALRRLIVLPSPDLTGVPVEALLVAWKDAPSLVVSYAPSGTLFAQLAKAGARRPDTSKLLAVGDPYYDLSSTSTLAPPPNRGVLITAVEYPNNRPGGIELDDVLLSYDGQDVLNPVQFEELFREVLAKRRSRPPSESFKPRVTVWRDGRSWSFVLDPDFASIRYGRPSKPSTRLARPSRPSRPGTRPGFGSPPGFTPTGRSPSLSRLPGTRLEILAIAALFPRMDATTLLGDMATKTRVQSMATSGELADYRFLHFATHGTVDPDVAMSSALILGPEAYDLANPSVVPSDGRITAEQILNTWNLDAEMVVFSACQTGLGKKVRGEGYLGFAQALFIKGARSLVLSQWSVSDVATALLMERFYQNLLGKRRGLAQPMSKAEALDEAKRWLRNLTKDEVIAEIATLRSRGAVNSLTMPGQSAPSQPAPQPMPTDQRPFEHPQFWAGFILIGGPS
jgi:tetratricopeptide (TPR) repeat protein